MFLEQYVRYLVNVLMIPSSQFDGRESRIVRTNTKFTKMNRFDVPG